MSGRFYFSVSFSLVIGFPAFFLFPFSVSLSMFRVYQVGDAREHAQRLLWICGTSFLYPFASSGIVSLFHVFIVFFCHSTSWTALSPSFSFSRFLSSIYVPRTIACFHLSAFVCDLFYFISVICAMVCFPILGIASSINV